MRFLKPVPVFILLLAGHLFAQTSSEQQKLIEKYLRQKTARSVSQTPETERYQTPALFSEQDSQFYMAVPQDSAYPWRLHRDSVSGSLIYGEKRGGRADSTGLRVFGCDMFQGSPETFSPIMDATPPPDYVLGPGDNMLVNVWGRVDMQLDLTVDREGKVFIPKVGELVATGLNLDGFKDRLDRGMSSAYSGYQLSVTLGKIRRIKVFVYGEVKRPGGYTTSSLATLFNALYLAGGTSSTGSLRSVRLVRNNRVIAEIDLYKFLLEGDNRGDAKLESGDVVFVPVVGPLAAISGQVKRPAIYELKESERASDLVRLAGGFTAEAFLEKISIDRVSNDDSRIIRNVSLVPGDTTAENDIVLADGDRVTVPSIHDFKKNTVILAGHVKHPGIFGLTDSMRVSDLLDSGEQLKRDAYLDRANLFRTLSDNTREVYKINLSEILGGVDSTDRLLADKDSIVVYSQKQLRRKMTVSIHGAVKAPGTYEYFDNMKLSDIIFLAGNTLRQSYMLQAEVARVNPGQPATVLYVDLEKAMNGGAATHDIPLQEDDAVYVRNIPQWRVDESVSIEGEVMFPGIYSLTLQHETLSDLLRRCGGFTPEAFPSGTVFIRKTISEEVEKRQLRSILASTEPIMVDSMYRIEYQTPVDSTVDYDRVNRIVIDVEKLLLDPNSPDNVVMRKGDSVYVPARPAGVQVLGAVALNGTITYKDNKKLDYFVKSAGGFAKDADKKQTRLVKANGTVLSGSKAFKSQIEAGDAIIVPKEIKKEKHWLQSSATIAALVSSLATTVLILDRLK